LQASNIRSIIPVILITIIYLFLSFFRFSGLMAYLIPITCWGITAIIALFACGLENIRQWLNKHATIAAFLIAILQFSALIFVSFFTSFGRSPYIHTPTTIFLYIAYFASPLIAFELSRALLIKSCPKRKIFAGMALTALFYTFISFPLTKFLSLGEPAETVKFIGSDLLPTLAQSLLATYLALLGGPAASIAYMGPLTAFEWLSPILPNPPWALKALTTTLVPVVGFMAANQTVSSFKLVQLGIMGRSELKSRLRRSKSTSLGWVAIAIIGVILLWGSTGLLGFQPSIIASGSMRPTLDVGDIAVTVQTPPEKIRVGDIIQYWRQGETAPIIHRVIEISQAGATTYITTKGDANTAADEPIIISSTQRLGKVVLIIPKLGWASIYMKQAISSLWEFFENNHAVAYATLGITLISAAFGIHTYRNQPLRKLRRRLKR